MIGPGDPIQYPAVVPAAPLRGRAGRGHRPARRDVPAEKALDVVLGYTCANDVTARDQQKTDGQWTRAKGYDTFCPLGPWIETDVDPADLAVTTALNGELRQAGRTRQLIHGIAD